jgi:hypothetical protein
LDLFNNPVGYFTSLGKMLRILLFFSGICSETEVSEQLYYFDQITVHIKTNEQILVEKLRKQTIKQYSRQSTMNIRLGNTMLKGSVVDLDNHQFKHTAFSAFLKAVFSREKFARFAAFFTGKLAFCCIIYYFISKVFYE